MEKSNLVERDVQIIKKRMLVLDTTKCGLGAVWRGWETGALDALMSSEEKGSRLVWENVRAMGYDISRASVIIFLNKLVDAGFADYREESCKGGSRRVYSLTVDRQWSSINDLVVDRFLFKLWELFPDNERIMRVIK